MATRTIGIDFGTTTTLIAEGGPGARPTVVPMGDATAWMPSVAARRDGEFLVGEDALRVSPDRLIRSVKRCITKDQYTITTPDGERGHDVNQVVLAVLTELAARAKFENLPIEEPGIGRLGCPAMWDAKRRRRLLDLAQAAGFGVGASTLIDEPIAAGIMWINDEVRRGRFLDEARVLVFDMGGGTLDVAVLDVTAGPGREPEVFVLASDGLDEAGDALDLAIAKDVEGHLGQHGVALADLPDEGLARAYLLRAATEAKVALSEQRSTMVDVGYTTARLPIVTYTREELDDALRPQMDRAWALIESTLRAAYLTREGGASTIKLRALPASELTKRISHVLITGGMSQVPGVAGYLGPRFPDALIHQNLGVPPTETIVAGLAETTSYERVNLHRPGFDFVLEWRNPDGSAQQLTLYRAYTPFYEPWEAQSKDVLRYTWPDGATAVEASRRFDLPRSGSAVLRVVAMDESRVALRFGGHEADGLHVEFGHSGIRFALSPDGSVYVKDGLGTEQRLRADRWPVLRAGVGRVALNFERAEWKPVDRRSWDTK